MKNCPKVTDSVADCQYIGAKNHKVHFRRAAGPAARNFAEKIQLSTAQMKNLCFSPATAGALDLISPSQRARVIDAALHFVYKGQLPKGLPPHLEAFFLLLVECSTYLEKYGQLDYMTPEEFAQKFPDEVQSAQKAPEVKTESAMEETAKQAPLQAEAAEKETAQPVTEAQEPAHCQQSAPQPEASAEQSAPASPHSAPSASQHAPGRGLMYENDWYDYMGQELYPSYPQSSGAPYNPMTSAKAAQHSGFRQTTTG